MKIGVTRDSALRYQDGYRIDESDVGPPALVSRYLPDTKDDGIGPNGVTVAIWGAAGDHRAAVESGGDWQWGDHSASETDDDILDLYLAGEWERRN